MKKLSDKESYQFPIISDANGEISKKYNTFGKPIDYDTIKSEVAIPTTYLIDSNGVVVWKYVGTKTERPGIRKILEAIDTYL